MTLPHMDIDSSSPVGDDRRQPRESESRPRLLFLCQTMPYPPHGGVSIRTYNILRQLSRAFDITALCFYRRAQHADAATRAANLAVLRETVDAEAFPIHQEHRRARLLWDHARSVLRRRPFTTYTYESEEFERRLEALLDETRFDLAHVDSLDLARYLPILQRRVGPTVCVHHNIESSLLARRAAAERTPWRQRYLAFQARLLAAEEREWYDRVELNVVVSANDRDGVARIAPHAPVEIVPNGVDVDAFVPLPGRAVGLIFAGGAGWFPNRDGMEFLGREILPLVRGRAGDVPVTWVGRASAEERERFAREHGISMTGYVPDVRPYLADGACYVVPLRVGGGTRLKILDAWAMGKAIVSTSIGCEGLDARDGENMLIRDTPADFADAVCEVLRTPALRRALGSAGRRTVESTYAWDVIGPRMNRAYCAVLTRSASRAVSPSAR